MKIIQVLTQFLLQILVQMISRLGTVSTGIVIVSNRIEVNDEAPRPPLTMLAAEILDGRKSFTFSLSYSNNLWLRFIRLHAT